MRRLGRRGGGLDSLAQELGLGTAERHGADLLMEHILTNRPFEVADNAGNFRINQLLRNDRTGLWIGLVVFTVASVWCAFSTTIGMLIAARAVQGIGAALITPQTMAIVTRIFPTERRGAAMGVWGIVAGVATMVGPLLGGVLTDSFGWKWIFLINLPVGIIGLIAAQVFVPRVTTHDHKFDWIGVLLSGIGLAALVFGIQCLAGKKLGGERVGCGQRLVEA